MNLVVGATGVLGQEICRQLCEAGRPVRALVRASAEPEKTDPLAQLGVGLIYGDLRNRASLEVACQGIENVITTASAMPFAYEAGENDIQQVDLAGMQSLIEVARRAGIDHFVYTSVTGNADGFDFPLVRAKRAVERKLQGSGMAYTILRPSYFMEVWLSPALGFDVEQAKATIYGDGDAPIAWIAVPDIARFAVESLENPAAHNAVIELGGPEMLSPKQVVSIFERLSGRKFDLSFVSAEALAAQQAAATDPMQQSFSGIMRLYAAGDRIDMTKTLHDYAFDLTGVETYAERTLRSAKHAVGV